MSIQVPDELSSQLGALMREQKASRLGFYPDGNPNAAIAAAPQPQVAVTDAICDRVADRINHGAFEARPWAIAKRYLEEFQSELGPALGLSNRDAEIAQLRADAERYRFLRSCNIDMRNRLEHYADSALDTAIDAARGGE